MSYRRRFPSSLPDALDDEWPRLAVSSAAVGLANEWHLIARPVTTLHALLAATGYRPPIENPRSPYTASDETQANAVLAGLVRRAASDPLAGRIVLQRILPGLRAAGRAWRRGCTAAGVEAGDVMDELIGVSWEVISNYDVDRRPHRIAGNLIRATTDRAFTRPTRRRAATEQRDEPATFDRWCTTGEQSASDELTGVLADAMEHRDADPAAVRLLRDLVDADGSTSAVAERHHVTPRTIRTRRHQAITHLRDLLTDDAA